MHLYLWIQLALRSNSWICSDTITALNGILVYPRYIKCPRAYLREDKLGYLSISQVLADYALLPDFEGFRV